MTFWMAALLVLMVILFILADSFRDRKQKSRVTRPPTEISRRRTATLVRIEQEVDAKLEEIRKEQGKEPTAIANPPAIEPPAGPPPSPGERDPLSDTRSMQVVKEKAEEIERLAKERGLTG